LTGGLEVLERFGGLTGFPPVAEVTLSPGALTGVDCST